MKIPWQTSGRIYVVAEIGNNHNGSTKTARELIAAFAATGADAVKFQAFRAEDIVTPFEPMRDAEKWDPEHKFDKWMDFARTLELPVDAYADLIDYTHAAGLNFVLTPTSPNIVQALDGQPVDVMKVASMDITNRPLLEAIAHTGLPAILSTGMANYQEIAAAIAVLEARCPAVAVLHCSSVYPLPEEDANLATIGTLSDSFNRVTGYSDHTRGIAVPVTAAACGARIIEKHVTLDKQSALPGEHFFSIEPDEMKTMVDRIRDVKVRLGKPQTDMNPKEWEVARKFRRSIMVTRDLAAGERIRSTDICCLRPGTGLSPFEIDSVTGKTAARAIAAYVPLTEADIE